MKHNKMIDDYIKTKTNNGMVYLITDGEFVKIGYTKTSIKKRIEAMQTGNANKLDTIAYAKVPMCEKVEMYIHKRYEKFRHRREWFKFDTDGHVFDIVKILTDIEKDNSEIRKILSYLENETTKTRKRNSHAKLQAGIA